jgi:hypothetical protein
MSERKRLFLKVLKAELEDCLEDVEDLANLYERKFCGEEITNYVYNENEALLKRELSGLKNILQTIDDVALDRYESVDALAADIDGMIQKKVLDFEDPQAVYGIAKRKLLKVLRYTADQAI